MKLLFTGSSSFTGFHILNELAKNDNLDIHAIVSKKITQYDGLKRLRLNLLNEKIKIHENIQFGDDAFLDLLKLNNEKFDILCCHGAYVENYNSNEFDLNKAVSINTKNIALVFEKFKENNGNIIINTGSIFEPNEGEGDVNRRAFNPYGLSKYFTNQIFKYYSQIHNISFGKFVIPNPFGQFEEPRFTNYLFNCWSKNETPLVRTPKYIRDNVPVDLLAKSYSDFVVKIIDENSKSIISQDYQFNPSGYVESQQLFTKRIIMNINNKFNLEYKVEFYDQIKFDQPISRYNNNSLFGLYPNWNENQFWIDYLEFYLSKNNI